MGNAAYSSLKAAFPAVEAAQACSKARIKPPGALV